MTTLSEAIENQISMTNDSDFYVWFEGEEHWFDINSIPENTLSGDIEDYCFSFVKVIHMYSDYRGIYIPRDFAKDFEDLVEPEDLEVLLDPEHEQYWDTWYDVLNYVMIPHNGLQYHLYHDGALYAIADLDE